MAKLEATWILESDEKTRAAAEHRTESHSRSQKQRRPQHRPSALYSLSSASVEATYLILSTICPLTLRRLRQHAATSRSAPLAYLHKY